MIYAGFSTTNGILSGLVRFFTQSPCSHSFVLFDYHFVDDDIPMVIESTDVGVRLIPYSEYLKTNKIVALLPIVGEHRNAMLSDLKPLFMRLGEPYDVGGLIGQFFVQIGRRLKKRWKNPFNSKALFCSEALAEVLKQVGYPGASEIVSAEMAPSDLLNFMTNKTI